jgi:putative transposase
MRETPKQNAICERFLGRVRRECLDHLLILGERHLRHILREYVTYFNEARPHQGIGQQVPQGMVAQRMASGVRQPIQARPILAGLHHIYGRAA